MAACETCWQDAFSRSKLRGGSQVDHYHQLLSERDGSTCLPHPSDSHCSQQRTSDDSPTLVPETGAASE